MDTRPADKKRNCRKCRYFFITWDADHPYGCKAMGFKGKQLPSTVVLKSSGEPCLLFREKHAKSG